MTDTHSEKDDRIANRRPYTLAAAFLRAHDLADVGERMQGSSPHPTLYVKSVNGLRYWREEFFLFGRCAYRRHPSEELVSDVTTFLNDAVAFDASQDPQALNVTNKLVSDVVGQLRAVCQARGVERMPAWLVREAGDDRPDPDDVIAFQNGLLSIPGWLDDPACSLLSPTPDWFSETVMPYDWLASARCDRWLRFLNESLADQELIGALQEYFGYCLTSSTRHQKLLWLHGVSGAGKSTVANVLRNVVGDQNCTSFELWDLLGRFTLSSWVGKRVAISADAALGQGADAARILGKIKGITGEDPQYVDRKNKDPLTGVLQTRLVISTNEFPHLPDTADALARRAIFVPFDRSFQNQHDPHLPDQLRAETPGITIWAMQGLVRLTQRGRFPDPGVASAETQDEFKRLQSAVYAFVQDCCLENKYDADRRTGQTSTDDLYRAYKKWSKETDRNPMSRERFCSRLRAAAPFAVRHRPKSDGVREYVYRNIILQPRWVHVPVLPD